MRQPNGSVVVLSCDHESSPKSYKPRLSHGLTPCFPFGKGDFGSAVNDHGLSGRDRDGTPSGCAGLSVAGRLLSA